MWPCSMTQPLRRRQSVRRIRPSKTKHADKRITTRGPTEMPWGLTSQARQRGKPRLRRSFALPEPALRPNADTPIRRHVSAPLTLTLTLALLKAASDWLRWRLFALPERVAGPGCFPDRKYFHRLQIRDRRWPVQRGSDWVRGNKGF